MKETNRQSIEIKEAKASAFRLLLQYIYTGKLQLRDEQVNLDKNNMIIWNHQDFFHDLLNLDPSSKNLDFDILFKTIN